VVNDDLANLLVSADIATVFLDAHLRIKRFTAAASQVFNLRTSDVGRPLNHIASNLVGVDLTQGARTVLQALAPLEQEVGARDGRQYVLRVLPYRTENQTVQGVVLTLVDVTTLKKAEHALRIARERVAEDLRCMTRLHALSTELVDFEDLHARLTSVVRAAVDITTAQMGDIQLCDDSGTLTMAAHTGFDRTFLDFFARVGDDGHSPCAAAATSRERVLVEDVTTSPIFTGHPSLAVMTEAGARAVQSAPLFNRSGRFLGMFSTHYRDVHRFDEAEQQWLDLLARHAADVIEAHRVAAQLTLSYKELETRVADRTRWLMLMHDVALEINAAATWDDALHRVLRRLCQSEHWQIGFVYVPRPELPDTLDPIVSCFGEDRFRAFHDVSMRQTYALGDRLPGYVYASNEPFWAVNAEALVAAIPIRAPSAIGAGLQSGVALPIAVRDEVVAVLEIFSDEVHPPSEQLTALIYNVGDQIGRVLERERATARMADLVWREQQELLHTLHDSLGQTLTGIGMLSTALRQSLVGADSGTTYIAAEIAGQTQRALDQVRLLSKSLFPVEVEAESLMAALRDLAAATAGLHKIQVRVEGAAPKELRDGKVANEFYRIAQEAVTNSVKHSHARTVTIRIAGDAGLTRLEIADDGIGIPYPEPADGAGLRIMRYRAASIGASLAVERGARGGTVVTCSLREFSGSGRATT
jgi:signal transduction histidine kinase